MQLPSDIFTTVTIKRYAQGSYTNGIWTDGAETTTTIVASVQPSDCDTLHEEAGYRKKESVDVFSPSILNALDEKTGTRADRIYWEGYWHKVLHVDFHYLTPELSHYKAHAMREQST
jgi:hypothetical protein